MIYSFDGYIPVIHPSAFIHDQATITGNVTIGENVYIGPGAAVRGDWGSIEIKDGCNIQENCTIHMFPGINLVLEEDAHIGHGAIIHGAHIGRNVLVGMNSVIMDNAEIGEESIIGALTMIPAGKIFERRSLIVGNPGKRIKEVSEEMIQWKTKGTQLYQTLPNLCRQSLKEVEPLREISANRKKQMPIYQTWKEIKSK
jgi:carbonic anhydrase/acetyltransferase-like protein (isoleucine patch superfamily)